jgi:hypothetical protein
MDCAGAVESLRKALQDAEKELERACASREQVLALVAEDAKARGGRTGSSAWQGDADAASLCLGDCVADAMDAAGKVRGVALEAHALRKELLESLSAADEAIRELGVLHAARLRVESALERVDDVVDLRSCTADVAVSVRTGDLEAAALAIQRFRAISATLPVAEEDRARVDQAEEAISVKCRAALGSAMERGDSDGVRHGCRVLSLLGRGAEGLSRFIAYLRESIRAELPSALVKASGVDAEALPVGGTVASSAAEMGACWREWYAKTGITDRISEVPATGVNIVSAAMGLGVALLQRVAAFVADSFDSSAISKSEAARSTKTFQVWSVQPGMEGEGTRLISAAVLFECGAAAAECIDLVGATSPVTSLVGARSILLEVSREVDVDAGIGLCPSLALVSHAVDGEEGEGGAAGCMWLDLSRKFAEVPGGVAVDGSQVPSIAVLPPTLDTLTLLLARQAKFRSLIVSRVSRPVSAWATPEHFALLNRVGDCISVYSVLEQLQMELSLSKGASIEASDSVRPARSSLIEDACWVCQKCLDRSAATQDPAAVNRVARHVARVWSEGLRASLRLRIEANLGAKG